MRMHKAEKVERWTNGFIKTYTDQSIGQIKLIVRLSCGLVWICDSINEC
jgi:hypothetical protein